MLLSSSNFIQSSHSGEHTPTTHLSTTTAVSTLADRQQTTKIRVCKYAVHSL